MAKQSPDSGAAGGGGIRVTGARELRRALKQAEGSTREFSALHRSIAKLVHPVAVRNTPVLTGALKSTVRASGTASSARIVIGGKPRGTFYKARRLRDGSIRIYPNRPILEVKYAWIRENQDRFLEKSIADTRPQWLDLYVVQMRQIADKVKGA